MSEDDMVMLMECEDGVEAEAIRGLLDAHGIPHVIHGDNRGSYSAMLVALSVSKPVILVPKRELQTATDLLNAKPVLDETATDPAALLDGNVCPVHERPAVAICTRCGTFLCAGCGSLGQPPLCEDCLKIDEPKGATSPMVKLVATVWLAFYALPFVLLGVTLLWIFFFR